MMNENDTSIELVNLYNEFNNALSLLPENIITKLNVAYLNLERSVSSIPKDVLLRFIKEFEDISDDLPEIYFNPNDYGNSNFSFIFEKLKIYYDFVSEVPYQMIVNLLKSYNEYVKLYKQLPKEEFDKVLNTYKDYKICYDMYSNQEEIISKVNDYNSIFLDRALLYKQNESLTLLSNIKMGNTFNDDKYTISSELTDNNGHSVVIPVFTREDYMKLVNDSGSIEMASQVCDKYINVVYQSLFNVNLCLNNDIILLSNIKSNMESSYLFVNLEDNKKKDILSFISDQIGKRYDLVKIIEKDLKGEWNKVDVSSGADMDSFNKFEAISLNANRYETYFSGIMSLAEIVKIIGENGYRVQ